MKEIKLEITTEGGLAMLHDDDFNMKEFGQVQMKRASHVEPAEDGTWFVQSAKTLKMLKEGFETRKEALDWEKKYYSPDGQGWNELD